MFTFEKCTYDELQVIRHKEDFLLSDWTLLEKEYIDETEKIYDEDGTMVALSNYYFLNENKERMMIALFEVFKPYRNRGLGKRIIAHFLQDYHGEVHLEPSGEDAVGHELAKKCPVLIIQNNLGNKKSTTTICLCLSTKCKYGLTYHVHFNDLNFGYYCGSGRK